MNIILYAIFESFSSYFWPITFSKNFERVCMFTSGDIPNVLLVCSLLDCRSNMCSLLTAKYSLAYAVMIHVLSAI